MPELKTEVTNYESQSALYDEAYYRHGCGPIPYGRTEEWTSFFGVVADHIVRSLRPAKVFDAGCAIGLLVEALWERGVEAWGMDISRYAISQLRKDMVPYCSYGSLCEPIPGRYDLITCIEVIEHIPVEEMEAVVQNLCAASDLILFSSTPFDFEEPTHCNVRPLIHWLSLFRRFDFWPDVLFDASFIANHAMLLRRAAAPSSSDTLSLFSKALHWRVEIGNRTKDNARLTAEIATWRQRHELLERQHAGVLDKLQAAGDANTTLRRSLHEAEGDRAALMEELRGLTVQNRTLAERIAGLESDRVSLAERVRNLEADKLALDNLQQEMEAALQRTVDEQALLRNHLGSLESRNRELASEIQSVHGSPGWQAIERYRKWRLGVHARHPVLMKTYERAATTLLCGMTAHRLEGRPQSQEVVQPPQDSPDVPAAMSPAALPVTSEVDDKNEENTATQKLVLMISGCPGDAFRYRCDHQSEELQFFGLTVDTVLFDQVDYEKAVTSYEVFLLHRVPHTPGIETFVRRARGLGKPVMFDTDDLIFNESLIGEIKAIRDFSPEEYKLYVDGVRRYHRTLSLCSGALVTTEDLRDSIQELFPDMPVFINRNAVSDQMVSGARDALESVEPPNDGLVRLAYLSGTRTHQDDFAECEGALARVMRRHSQVRLMIVGHLDISATLRPLADRIEKTPLIPWGALPALMRRADISLAPLEMANRFTAAKSELKYFEAGLLGLPTVASAVPSYRYAISHGENGLLASNEEEWFENLESLVLDSERRVRIGQNARRDVLSRYTTRNRAPELFEVMGKVFHQHGWSTPLPLSIAFVTRAPIAQTGGGYKNIFILAHHLAAKGHDVHIYIEAIAHLAGKTEAESIAFCHRHFGESRATIHLGHDRILPSDVAIATNWPTAYTVDQLRNTKCRLYLIQDYEPDFYEAGDPLYRAAEKTYALPLRKVALGKYLGTLFSRRDGLPVPSMKFSLDRTVFVNRRVRSSNTPVRILFSARPGLKRRAYSVGVDALRLVAQACPKVRIAFYGMAKREDLGFAYENLGELSPEEVASAMNNSHIHLSFSLTNISWVPFEAMACGCAVVEAKVPSVELWMDGEPEVCMLLDPTPTTVAEGMIQLINDSGLRRRLGENGERYIDTIATTWAETCVQFEKMLLESLFRTAASHNLVADPA